MPTDILLSNGNILDLKRTFHGFAANGTNDNRGLPLYCEILNEVCLRTPITIYQLLTTEN